MIKSTEKEGCGSMDHVRVQPKRMVGNGSVMALKGSKKGAGDTSTVVEETSNITSSNNINMDNPTSFFEEYSIHDDEDKIVESEQDDEGQSLNNEPNNQKKSWAMLVNPTAANKPSSTKSVRFHVADAALATNFGSMSLSNAESMLNTLREEKVQEAEDGGQFSDAEDDESIEIPKSDCCDDDESSDDGEEYASIGEDFSDEECDVYILDPEEFEEKRRRQVDELKNKEHTQKIQTVEPKNNEVIQELEMEFPSLAAASTVQYEGSDDENEEEKEIDQPTMTQEERLKKAAEEEAQRRANSLKPVSKSGKIYNTLGKYRNLSSAKGIKIGEKNAKKDNGTTTFVFAQASTSNEKEPKKEQQIQSRVIGGIGMSGQSTEVDDDGEGWVTSTREIVAMKASGKLDPFRNDRNDNQQMKPQENLPSKNCRTACATTDFAMQNVILQMNLELLTVDGVRVRKLKSWVQRCSTCHTVYTSIESTRLFCDRCGSSSIQRVAASVDGKTGRLKLHLKKNYQQKLRGTKYCLPKAGTQNKFMGDLLLSEDQLMYGALNQRVKQTRSKNAKASQSIFGADLAATLGCVADLSKRGDIKVGFGRKNPNATKFGRERRGKKKKSTDKVCGLRRY